jgi:hypothetical protein
VEFEEGADQEAAPPMKRRPRSRSSGHRRPLRKRENSPTERTESQSAPAKNVSVASSELVRERGLVEHSSSSASHGAEEDRPKRTGWWARARATLTGDTRG